VAIVADGDGRRPRTVTPVGSQIWNVAFDPDTGLAYLYAVPDTDHDGVFTTDDAPEPCVFDPRTDAPALPVVSPELRQRLTALLR
jgi:hypothetical protein